MATRNYFTHEEIVLCTYAAMYKADDFGGLQEIERLTLRSAASIKLKVQNIAAMLDEAGVERDSDVRGLSGLPAGEHGRATNWDEVSHLYPLPREQFLHRCREVLATA